MKGSIFGSLFVKALELLGCPLGPFLGVLRLFWDASGPQKTLKKQMVFKVFAHAGVWGSKVLVFVLGLLRLFLVGSGPKIGSPKSCPNGSIWGLNALASIDHLNRFLARCISNFFFRK